MGNIWSEHYDAPHVFPVSSLGAIIALCVNPETGVYIAFLQNDPHIYAHGSPNENDAIGELIKLLSERGTHDQQTEDPFALDRGLLGK